MLNVERVHSRALRNEVYELRYRAYLHEGVIDPCVAQRFSDGYDEQPNHILWALFDEGNLVGSIRSTWFHPGVPWVIPEVACFGDRIEGRLPTAARLISANRFVTEPHRPDRTRKYAMELLRHHLEIIPSFADYGIAAVRANHLPFYKRILKMECISDARIYPGLKCPMYLLAAEVSATLHLVYRDVPGLRPPEKASEEAAA